MLFNFKNKSHSTPFLKTVQAVLLVLIVVGIGLLMNQEKWVPKVVNYLLEREDAPTYYESGLFESGPETDDWVTAKEDGIMFKYPSIFPLTYTTPLEWPPEVSVSEAPFVCTEGGTTIEEEGEVRRISVNGVPYCVKKHEEGAAGSIYTEYEYTFAFNGGTGLLALGTRSVQCGNFDEDKKRVCEEEKTSFDLNELIDDVVGTMSVAL